MDTERQETVRVLDNGERTATQKVITERSTAASPLGLLRNIVSFLFSILIVLLGIRFVFSLLGANRGNGFADFIYNASNPFIAPFRGLFNTDTVFGVSRFEYEALIAIAIYALFGWLIIWLLSLSRSDV